MAPGVDALGRCHGPEQVGDPGESLFFGFFREFKQTLVCLGFTDECVMDVTGGSFFHQSHRLLVNH